MGWTVVFSTLETGVDSFTMTSSHDGATAWEEAERKIRSRFGPDTTWKIYAIVKGMNPIYTKCN